MVALVNKAGAARGSKGFTLVELLVVIVVIGILAAIAVPIFLSQSDKANDAALQSDLANAAKLLQVAEASGETLPSTMTAGQVTDLGVAGTITPNATLTVSGSGSTLCVEGTSDSGDTYSVSMTSGLTMTDCADEGNGVSAGFAVYAGVQAALNEVLATGDDFGQGYLLFTPGTNAEWAESNPALIVFCETGSCVRGYYTVSDAASTLEGFFYLDPFFTNTDGLITRDGVVRAWVLDKDPSNTDVKSDVTQLWDALPAGAKA